jgi:hypothetical protein
VFLQTSCFCLAFNKDIATALCLKWFLDAAVTLQISDKAGLCWLLTWAKYDSSGLAIQCPSMPHPCMFWHCHGEQLISSSIFHSNIHFLSDVFAYNIMLYWINYIMLLSFHWFSIKCAVITNEFLVQKFIKIISGHVFIR